MQAAARDVVVSGGGSAGRRRPRGRLLVLVIVALVAALLPLPGGTVSSALAVATPVATDEPTYQAFGRAFPDPHGCFVQGGMAPPDGSPVSPWAKGRVCATDYLAYTEVLEGVRFLQRRFPDFVQVVPVEDALSAGIARALAFENGEAELFGRDRSPLYLYKVTHRDSATPEADRLHFAFSMAIHGLERAGLEGGVRAMEDLVTWAACEKGAAPEADEDAAERAAATPACTEEGPFPKPIVEGETDRPVPTALQTLDESVMYFFAPNPDGWRYGEKRAIELRNGDPNVNHLPGPSHSRYNGHAVDLNRDWPTVGYTLRSHQPWSEPETRSIGEELLRVRDRTSGQQFAGGIDLHGMLTANAFSYTLLGADQRDYRKNAITVETSLRTWEDQTQRLRWSPYIGDSDGDGEADREAIIPVADQWGTVFDTLGYTITGGLGFWMDDSRIGLGGVGINNEMALSHMAPNNVYEPALIQTHIDGNKGLIYSQLSALLLEAESRFTPNGRIGYVENPERLVNDGVTRPENVDDLPAQEDIEVILPCRNDLAPQLPDSCGDGAMSVEGSDVLYEFEVKGPYDGVWNGGMTVSSTAATQMVGHQVAVHAGVTLERYEVHGDHGDWVEKKSLQRTSTTYNDPEPGRWRLRVSVAPAMPRRVDIVFDPVTAEADPGQLPYDVANTDFFADLNDYVDGEELEALTVEEVAAGTSLDGFDTLVVANEVGDRSFLETTVGLSAAEADAYFAALGAFAEQGGNLVLTDGALQALAELGLVGPDDVERQEGLAGFYAFRTGDDTVTYEDPETYPLAAGVDLPGAAERQLGSRQAVEPPTLGFSPSGNSHAAMPFWGVDRTAWEAKCHLPEPGLCTTAATSSRGSLASVGEVAHGEGVIRIVGALLPNPNPVHDSIGDHRFGLGAYALTWTAYQVFENLVAWERPGGGTDPGTDPDPDPDPVATELEYTGDTRAKGNTVELAAVLRTVDGDALTGRQLSFDYDGETWSAPTDETGEARVEVPTANSREETVTVTFAGDDDHEPTSTTATIHRGKAEKDRTSSVDASLVASVRDRAATPGGATVALLVLLALTAALPLRRRAARRTS